MTGENHRSKESDIQRKSRQSKESLGYHVDDRETGKIQHRHSHTLGKASLMFAEVLDLWLVQELHFSSVYIQYYVGAIIKYRGFERMVCL